MATLTAGYVFGSTETVTNTKLGLLISAGSVTNIVNADIDAGAAIANSKLNLASVSQAISAAGGLTLTTTGLTLTSVIEKLAKGADVASANGNIALGDDGNYFDITGTNAITSITAKQAGTVVTLQFDSTATLTDGSNLKLQGNFTGAAEAQITLISDGTNWFEVSRNVSSAPSAASQAEMEAASSTTTYVSPGRERFHPGVAKVACTFQATATGTNNPLYGYNVSSVTRVAAGTYTVNLLTAFATLNSVILAGSVKEASSTIGGFITFSFSAAHSASAIPIIAYQGGGNARDWDFITLVMYGDM